MEKKKGFCSLSLARIAATAGTSLAGSAAAATLGLELLEAGLADLEASPH